MDHPDASGAHIEAARSGAAHHLIARAEWPAGGTDLTRPAAREWLRRWSPRHPVSGGDFPVCGCAAGRCTVCN